MNKKIIFLILSIHFSEPLFSQSPFTIYNTSNSPLPENSVRCVAFDTSGLKWIGTDFGLATFDDTNWTIYNTSNSGLPDNAIRSVAIDRFNNKWIGTFLGGLVKYDGISWTVFNSANSPLPDDYIKTIAFDTAGNKWIGTIMGLVKYDDAVWTIYDLSNSVFTLSDNITHIDIDTNNIFRIGTLNGGFLKIVDTLWTLYTIPNGSGIPDNTQYDVDVDNNGLEWMATPANGLVAHPGATTWNVYNQFTSGMPTSSTICMQPLANPDRIWVGTYDVGIVRKTGVAFNNYDPSNSVFPDYWAQCIEADENGILWIGTQVGGLVRLDESLLTKLPEVSLFSKPIVFPQPAKDCLTIFYPYSKFESVKVTDITGKHQVIIFSETSAGNYSADVSKLSAGIYFLRMQTSDGKLLTKKIVKAG
ncbi:MAG: T9SS type A sorting domain-containing protein [Bacteroidia bacterium]